MAVASLLRRHPAGLPRGLLAAAFSTCRRRLPLGSSPKLLPPVAKKVPFAVTAHGSTWDDPYHWMRDTGDPEFVSYIAAENEYADEFMSEAAGLRARLAAEMRARMASAASAPPEPWGPWLYYQHIPEGKEYPVLSRRLRNFRSSRHAMAACNSDDGREEILLDWNEIAERYGYVHIGTCRISPDHRFLAYTLDTSGRELFSLQVKDTQSSSIVVSLMDKGVVSLAWASDSSHLFYTVSDDTLRPFQVFCKKLQSGSADTLVFTEMDRSCCLDITNTKDFNYITINSNSRSSSEVHIINSRNISEGIYLVRRRVSGVKYFIEHHYGFFYILTNSPSEIMKSRAEGYYLARCKADKSLVDKWQVVLVPGQDAEFEDMEVFHQHIVIFLRKKGLPYFCSIKMPVDKNIEGANGVDGYEHWFFPMPSSLCTLLPGSNNDFMSFVFRVVVSSPVVPDVVVDYDMKEKKFTVVHQEEVPRLHDCNLSTIDSTFAHSQHECLRRVQRSQNWNDLSSLLSCKRVEVATHDGVSVPLTIVYSLEAHRCSESPGILHAYGSYGEYVDKSWCSDRLSLLARGWVLAYADVRGGGSSASWHQAGTKANKINSIKDLAACGLCLIEEGLVHENRLGAVGSSAGGLLVGAAINMFPDLFSAAVLKVPFLDICNSLMDPSLPLTVLDYDEFGDPRIQSEFEAIKSYSPYDNISTVACYPPVLVTASFQDSRVGVWEAAKWVAKLRDTACPSCSKSVILKTDMNSGHFGEGGRLAHCKDTALEYAFLIKALKCADAESHHHRGGS